MIISLRKKEREMWEGRRKGERERRKREEGWKGELVWRDESIGICGRVLGRRSYSLFWVLDVEVVNFRMVTRSEMAAWREGFRCNDLQREWIQKLHALR